MKKDTKKDVPPNIKEEFAEICLTEDPVKLRAFLKNNQEYLPESYTKKAGITDAELVEFMLIYMSVRPEFKEKQQETRNRLRIKYLEQEIDLASEDLKSYIIDHEGDYPLCSECHFLTTVLPENDKTCLHLGASHFDIACVAWKGIGASDDVSKSGKNSLGKDGSPIQSDREDH